MRRSGFSDSSDSSDSSDNSDSDNSDSDNSDSSDNSDLLTGLPNHYSLITTNYLPPAHCFLIDFDHLHDLAFPGEFRLS